MSTLTQRIEEYLKTEAFERKLEALLEAETIAVFRTDPSMGYPPGYFETLPGCWADFEFEVADDPPPTTSATW
jgi:hypothetical protein